MHNSVSNLVSMFTLDAGKVLIESIYYNYVLIETYRMEGYSWAHRTGENENKKNKANDKKIGQNVECL